ncbi:MAG TPA: hypothetical protein VND19_18745 [Acetobacteraceae bacterium]|nr:hypothetical protein [Acetobacteraceae bacterium]
MKSPECIAAPVVDELRTNVREREPRQEGRAQFPRTEAACLASSEAMTFEHSATTRLDRIRAANASRRADRLAVAAYGEELLPKLFGGGWHLSRRNATFPAGILTPRRYMCQINSHTWFDHPLVFRQDGTRGPDSPANCVIVGMPYGAVVDDELSTSGRQDAEMLGRLGWGIWWRPDLSTHYPGWTQLVVAKHGLLACAASSGFRPIVSPAARLRGGHRA